MDVIIDAYNLLYFITKADRVTDRQRAAFMKDIQRYAKRKGHNVIVVFDAGPYLFTSTERKKGVTITYSGQNCSADDVIVRHIKKHKGRHMMLVSSDRQLCSYAQQCGAETVDVHEFASVLKKDTLKKERPSDSEAIKSTQDSNPDVDALMQQVSLRGYAKEEPVVKDRRSVAQKPSKKERKRKQKIKKL